MHRVIADSEMDPRVMRVTKVMINSDEFARKKQEVKRTPLPVSTVRNKFEGHPHLKYIADIKYCVWASNC
jgi:hypothetical protein